MFWKKNLTRELHNYYLDKQTCVCLKNNKISKGRNVDKDPPPCQYCEIENFWLWVLHSNLNLKLRSILMRWEGLDVDRKKRWPNSNLRWTKLSLKKLDLKKSYLFTLRWKVIKFRNIFQARRINHNLTLLNSPTISKSTKSKL